MFQLLRSPSRSAAGAILYVTIGTLMVIWAGLWYFYFLMPQSDPPVWEKFTCVGTILSGFAIGLIGLLFGPIGREAKAADNATGVATTSPIAPVVVGGIGMSNLAGEVLPSRSPPTTQLASSLEATNQTR